MHEEFFYAEKARWRGPQVKHNRASQNTAHVSFKRRVRRPPVLEFNVGREGEKARGSPTGPDRNVLRVSKVREGPVTKESE